MCLSEAALNLGQLLDVRVLPALGFQGHDSGRYVVFSCLLPMRLDTRRLAGRTVAVVLLVCAVLPRVRAGACTSLSDCSGHGTCDATTLKCTCYDGWGSADDISYYKSPDCSKRKLFGGGTGCFACRVADRACCCVVAGVCPADKAWVDAATATDTAHALAECSNRGLCDRSTGKCTCFSGYAGDACQRSTLGVCVMRRPVCVTP